MYVQPLRYTNASLRLKIISWLENGKTWLVIERLIAKSSKRKKEKGVSQFEVLFLADNADLADYADFKQICDICIIRVICEK